MMRKVFGVIAIAIILFFILVTILFSGCREANAKWGIEKEVVPIPEDTTIIGDTIYFSVSRIDFERYRSVFLGYERFYWKRAVIDLVTGGGSLFDAMGMVSLLQEQQRKGKIIEIRGRGIIASAGLLILITGTPDYRFLDKNAIVMFHEMWSFKFFAIETPSDKEDEAAIFRKIQDKINDYVTSHSKISKEELNSKIKKKEFWMLAEEALQYGFADTLF